MSVLFWPTDNNSLKTGLTPSGKSLRGLRASVFSDSTHKCRLRLCHAKKCVKNDPETPSSLTEAKSPTAGLQHVSRHAE